MENVEGALREITEWVADFPTELCSPSICTCLDCCLVRLLDKSPPKPEKNHRNSTSTSTAICIIFIFFFQLATRVGGISTAWLRFSISTKSQLAKSKTNENQNKKYIYFLYIYIKNKTTKNTHITRTLQAKWKIKKSLPEAKNKK